MFKRKFGQKPLLNYLWGETVLVVPNNPKLQEEFDNFVPLNVWSTHTTVIKGKIMALDAKAAKLEEDSDHIACVHTWLKIGKNVKSHDRRIW